MHRGLGVLAGLTLAAGLAGCKRKEAPPAPPAPVVLVAPVEQRDVPVVREHVGSLDGYINVDIRARVAGFLQAQHYPEGALVQQGQLLFTIDPRQYQAQLDQARAALARAQANLTNANVTVRRLRPLARKRAVSRQDLDNAVSAQQQAAAQVASARAAVEQAELNLSYTRVTSPITGIAGIANVRVGNLVGQGQPTLLTTVSQVDPMRVDFTVTERAYLRYVARQQGQGDAGVSPLPPQLEVHLQLADGTLYPLPGRLRIASRELDPATGTLRLQALFPNPRGVLRPGQFGRVRLVAEVLHGALLVPQRAVSQLQGTNQVGVVGPDDVASIRSVELGPAVDGQYVVQRGLAAGERVIVEGLQSVKNGQKVTARPAPAAPAPDAGAPAPGAPGVGGAGAAPGAAPPTHDGSR